MFIFWRTFLDILDILKLHLCIILLIYQYLQSSFWSANTICSSPSNTIFTHFPYPTYIESFSTGQIQVAQPWEKHESSRWTCFTQEMYEHRDCQPCYCHCLSYTAIAVRENNSNIYQFSGLIQPFRSPFHVLIYSTELGWWNRHLNCRFLCTILVWTLCERRFYCKYPDVQVLALSMLFKLVKKVIA